MVVVCGKILHTTIYNILQYYKILSRYVDMFSRLSKGGNRENVYGVIKTGTVSLICMPASDLFLLSCDPVARKQLFLQL